MTLPALVAAAQVLSAMAWLMVTYPLALRQKFVLCSSSGGGNRANDYAPPDQQANGVSYDGFYRHYGPALWATSGNRTHPKDAKALFLGSAVRLWKGSRDNTQPTATGRSQVLWVLEACSKLALPTRRKPSAGRRFWNVALSPMGSHAKQVQQSSGAGLAKLWRAGDSRLSGMGRLRGVQGVGACKWLRPKSDYRSDRQRQGLQSRQLSMGRYEGSTHESAAYEKVATFYRGAS